MIGARERLLPMLIFFMNLARYIQYDLSIFGRKDSVIYYKNIRDETTELIRYINENSVGPHNLS